GDDLVHEEFGEAEREQDRQTERDASAVQGTRPDGRCTDVGADLTAGGDEQPGGRRVGKERHKSTCFGDMREHDEEGWPAVPPQTPHWLSTICFSRAAPRLVPRVRGVVVS